MQAVAASRILFHRHTPWQSEVRCSTNILATLFQRDGFDIAYMQGIVHGGNILARRGQWESWQAGPRLVDDALVFTPFALLPYSKLRPLSTRAAAYRSFRSCVPSIRSILNRSGFGAPDVIWTANPGSGVLKDLFPEAKLIFQVVDYYPAFAGPEIGEIERSDYARADKVLVIGEALRRHVSDCGVEDSRITVLGQGVHQERFQAEPPAPADIAGLDGPIAIWVGVLSKGDAALFAEAASALEKRGGSLVLIGPPSPWSERLAASRTNIHALGLRTPDQVAAYLVHADVGLMLYDRSRREVYAGQNPLKLYEYAAAGLGIVSTPHEEYRYLDVPCEVVNAPADVAAALNRVMDDLPAFVHRSRDFVRGRSWESVYSRARLAVETALEPGLSLQEGLSHADPVS